jgi:hypothetical protein
MGYSANVNEATKTTGNETMNMTATGAVKVNGYLARRTDDGDWQVSRLGTSIGYVDSLDEVEGLIAGHLERVRARLSLVQRKAQERKEEAFANTTGFSVEMIRAHNITEADGVKLDNMPNEIRAATKS